MKTYSKEDIKKLNMTLSVPDFLVKLGAEPTNIRKLNSKEEFRVNAFFRGGDNPNGMGIRFNKVIEKWIATDFTQRFFSNIDLLELATKYCKVPFQTALLYMEECAGKRVNLSKVKEISTVHFEQKIIDKGILETFNSGLHPYLHGRGYTPKTAEYFGLGWSLYGEMDERITIPIYNQNKELISIQGRDYSGTKDNKYKFLDGTGEQAKNNLYNIDKAMTKAKERDWLMVVEGCPSVWRMYQYGLENVVATLSTTVTDNQIKQMVSLGVKIVIFFDWDENQAGQLGALKLLKRLKELKVKNVYLINTKRPSSPDDMTPEEIAYELKHIKKIL